MPTREPIISDIGPSSIVLKWLPAKLPTGVQSIRPVTYRIEMREPPSGHWMPVAERVSATNYTVNFLNPDKDYTFRVFADLDGVESEPTASTYLPHRMGECGTESLDLVLFEDEVQNPGDLVLQKKWQDSGSSARKKVLFPGRRFSMFWCTGFCLFVDKMWNPTYLTGWVSMALSLCCLWIRWKILGISYAVCRRSDKILAEVHVKRYYVPGTYLKKMFWCTDFLCLWIRHKILGTSYAVCGWNDKILAEV